MERTDPIVACANVECSRVAALEKKTRKNGLKFQLQDQTLTKAVETSPFVVVVLVVALSVSKTRFRTSSRHFLSFPSAFSLQASNLAPNLFKKDAQMTETTGKKESQPLRSRKMQRKKSNTNEICSDSENQKNDRQFDHRK